MKKKKLNIVIVGNGVAGTKAAQTIRSLDSTCKITIISDEDTPFYLRPQLVDFIKGYTNSKKIIAKPSNFYIKNKINLLLKEEVLSIQPSKNTVILKSKKEITYDKLLIASGIRVDLSRYNLKNTKNIFSLKTLKDARILKKRFPRLKEITVFGENLLSFEFLRLLSERPNLKVRYLVRGKRIWPEFFDKKTSDIIEKILKSKGITVTYGFNVSEIIEKNGKLNLTSKNGKSLKISNLGAFDPIVPNVDFLNGSKVKLGKSGILVNSAYKTNIRNIYAAGDCKLRSDYFVNSWQDSWHDGRRVAFSMLGKKSTDGVWPKASFRIFDRSYISIGHSNPASKREFTEIKSPQADTESYRKIVLKRNSVSGAVFFGDVKNFTRIEELISSKRTLNKDEIDFLNSIFEFYREDGEFYSYNLICPVCKVALNFSDRSDVGKMTTCPVCGVELKISLTDVSLIKRLKVV